MINFLPFTTFVYSPKANQVDQLVNEKILCGKICFPKKILEVCFNSITYPCYKEIIKNAFIASNSYKKAFLKSISRQFHDCACFDDLFFEFFRNNN
jgi:hypothetical protein